MASSGSIRSSTYKSHLWLTLDWSQSSQSIANNTTTISWSLKLHCDGTINFSASKPYSINVNGTSYSGSYTGGASGSNVTKTIKSGSTTISHNSDGSKSFSASASFDIKITFSGTYIGSMSLSGSGTLNTIPRASSIIGWTGSMTISGSTELDVTIDRKSSSFTHTVTFSLGNYSKSLYGVATYGAITMPIEWLNELANVSSKTGTISVTTYNGNTQIGSTVYEYFTATRPRASSLSLNPSSIQCNGSNYIGVSISMANGNFRHTVTYAFGSYSNSFSGIGGSHSYAIPQSWLNAIPSSTSGSGTVTVTTYYGSINLGSNSAYFTLTVPDNVKPNLKSVTDEIINPSQISAWGIYLKNISNCKLSINASGSLGSSISKVYVNSSSVSNPYTDKSLNTSGSKTYSVYVTDSRGRTSNTIVKTISIVNYEIPTLKVNKLLRCLKDGTPNDEGEFVIINTTYTMASCNGKNAITRLIQHKETTSSYYTEDGSFDTDVNVILSGYEINKTYDFTLSVMDTVGKVATYTGDGIIPTAIAIIDILNGGKGISFGKMASLENVIDCGWGIKSPCLYDEDGNKVDISDLLVFINE